MKEADFNFVDRFLYKFFIGVFLLFVVVGLDRLDIVDMQTIKTEMSEHFNILKAIKLINGEKSLFIPIEITDEITVSQNAYNNYKLIDQGARVMINEMQGVENYMTGVVIEIYRNSDNTYRLKVKGIDGYVYVYDKLENHDCNLYKVVSSGDILGRPNTVGDVTFFEFFVFNKGKVIELLK